MYPWNVLGMEPSEDRKAIKKAYAVLLKKHRPDEDPDGFQEINQAYQAALQILKQAHATASATVSQEYPAASQQADEVSQPTSEPQEPLAGNQSTPEPVELVHPNPPEVLPVEQAVAEQPAGEPEYVMADDPEADAHHNRQLELAEQLFNNLHAMAFASLQEKAELKNWAFLAAYDDIEDFDLRDQVAREVFRRVAEYNLFQRKETGLDLIPPEVLHHMAGLFNWEANWLDYSQHFPEHYLRCVFTELEKPVDRVRTNYKVGYVKRGLALVVDFVAYFLLLGMLASLIETLPAEGKLYFFTGFAGFRLSMELLMKNRSTFATNYFGYRFLDQYLNQPARQVTLKRFLALELMLTPFYLIIAGLFSVDTAIIIMGGYALAVMVWMFFFEGRLPHDVLSGTVAVKRLR